MSNATIPLAHQKFEPEKLRYPVLISEKVDGMPILVYRGYLLEGAVSRQGKHVPSVASLARNIKLALLGTDVLSVTGEVTDKETANGVMGGTTHRTPFKDLSGRIRRQEDDPGLYIIIFDAQTDNPDDMWTTRMSKAARALRHVKNIGWCDNTFCSSIVTTAGECRDVSEALLHDYPHVEGFIARSVDGQWEPGSRKAEFYQKIVKDPTIDLRIVAVEEAIDKHGNPKGMVGGLIALYNGERIGVGPGKLSHKDRTALWQGWLNTGTIVVPDSASPDGPKAIGPCVAEIKYKRDDSYDALRQPTFQRWRDDKDTPDA